MWRDTHCKKHSVKSQRSVNVEEIVYFKVTPQKGCFSNTDGENLAKDLLMFRLNLSSSDSMTYRLKPVDCYGRERLLRLKSSKLIG